MVYDELSASQALAYDAHFNRQNGMQCCVKTEALRELFCAKVKKGPFCDHLTLRNPERDENRFLKKNLPDLIPNPGFSHS